jgi:hypothetical protein
VVSAEKQKAIAVVLLPDGRDPSPRHYLGLARKAGSKALADAKLKGPGPVWANHPRCEPVRARMHQCNVARYIIGHAAQGAAVWCVKAGFRSDEPR